MLQKAVSFLADELNDFVHNKDHRYREKTVAVVSDLVDYKGEPVWLKAVAGMDASDFLVLTLINVEEETVGKSQVPVYKKPDQTLELLNPDIKLNLYLLISGVSTNKADERYSDCLRVLSYAAGFFQYKNVFNSAVSPTIPVEINRLVVEMVSLTFEQQNHIWGALGAKYQPSILYKVRLLTYREMLDKDGDLRIRTIDTSYNIN